MQRVLLFLPAEAVVALKNTRCSVEPSFPCFPDCSASFLSVKLLTLHPINMTSEPRLLGNGNHSKYFLVCAERVGGPRAVAFRQVFAYIPSDRSQDWHRCCASPWVSQQGWGPGPALITPAGPVWSPKEVLQMGWLRWSHAGGFRHPCD